MGQKTSHATAPLKLNKWKMYVSLVTVVSTFKMYCKRHYFLLSFLFWYYYRLGNTQLKTLYKKIKDFLVPSRDVTNQTLPGREELNYSRPEREFG